MPFINQKLGQLEYLTCDSIGVKHCFSTRLGGVSTGHLESLNLGHHRGDDPDHVLENYRILGRAVGFVPEQLVFTRQTHTDVVRVVDGSNAGEGLFRPVETECDALITNTPGLALTVFTADCTPILLYDPVTGAVGAVHAGWRGTAAAIAEKAVLAMAREFGANPENIQGAIGPNIGQCCFETDLDVPMALREALGPQAEAFIRAKGNGKYMVDLKGANGAFLRRAGVKHVEQSGECTACRPDRFWSHRRVGSARGSMAAIIVRERETEQ